MSGRTAELLRLRKLLKNKFFLFATISLLAACSSITQQQASEVHKTGATEPVSQNFSVVSEVPSRSGSSAPSGISGSVDEKLAHARSLIDKGEFTVAHQELSVLLAERPDDPSVIFSLAKVSMHLNLRSEGEAYFERYHYLMSGREGYKSGQMLLVLARLCRERDDIEASRAWLDKIEPNETDVYFLAQIQRAMLLAKENDSSGALALVATLEPKTPTELFQLTLAKAEFLRQSSKSEEAFEVLADGVPRVAPAPELLNLYASVANEIGRFEVAESAARAAIAIAPNDSIAYNNLASWFAERNVRLDEALQLVSRAREISPDDPYVMDTLGYVQYRLGNFVEAEAHLRNSYSLTKHPEIALHLVELLLRTGEREQALKLLREVSGKAATDKLLRDKIDRLQSTFQVLPT
jgi:Flp pilus assembly protein TadD